MRGAVIALVLLVLLVACGSVSGGVNTTPQRAGVEAPAWMLTPVPTADVGVDALDAWDCVTQPETVCTE